MRTIPAPVLEFDVARRRAPFRVVPLAVLAAGATGVAYGIALRAWMRLVSDDPEFSWSGSLFIVGAFTISFALTGLVVGGRRRGWRRAMVPARTVAIVISLSCFAGAGVVMLPTIVLGALALARTDWPNPVRVALAAVAGTAVTLAFLDAGHMGPARLVLAVAIYVVLVLVEIRIFAEPYRPTVARLPVTIKVAAIALAGVAVLGILAMAVGV